MEQNTDFLEYSYPMYSHKVEFGLTLKNNH